MSSEADSAGYGRIPHYTALVLLAIGSGTVQASADGRTSLPPRLVDDGDLLAPTPPPAWPTVALVFGHSPVRWP